MKKEAKKVIEIDPMDLYDSNGAIVWIKYYIYAPKICHMQEKMEHLYGIIHLLHEKHKKTLAK